MNPELHAISSVKRWKGSINDYINIHVLLDSVKVTMPDNRARAITHNTWFIYEMIPKVFGYSIINSDGKRVDTIDIAMLHVAEDFRMKFIPTVQDYLQHMILQPWMNNGVKVIDNPKSILIAEDFNNKLKENVGSLEKI